MAKQPIKFKNTVGAEGGLDLEQNSPSQGKVVWNKVGQKEHALFGKNNDKTLTYENAGQEHKIIHSGNIDEYIKDDINIEKDFTFPSMVWEFVHDKNKKLALEMQDTAGTKIRGQVVINDGTRVRVEFNFPVSGRIIGN